jgi:hypothetical protein
MPARMGWSGRAPGSHHQRPSAGIYSRKTTLALQNNFGALVRYGDMVAQGL